MDFWQELAEKKRPFFCLAPMADVTDCAFRELLTRYGKPDIFWTEFVSANGLVSAGRTVLQRDLEFSPTEQPIVAQLFTADPENMKLATKFCAELGFAGIDINMGCPDKTIERQGAGAKMITTPDTAQKIINAAKEGVRLAGKNIPISVKTRLGFNSDEVDTWIPFLLSQDIAALTVHARTRKELSKVPAHWQDLKRVVAHRDRLGVKTLIIGNGDITSIADSRQKALDSGCDGVMVGRALFGNPWFFDESREMVASIPRKQPAWIRQTFLRNFFETKRKAAQSKNKPITLNERLNVMVEHAKLFEQKLGDIKSFAIMKKHFKAYCTGFAGAKELRIKLMETKDAREVESLVQDFLLQ